MSHPYFSILTQITPASLPAALLLFSQLLASGIDDEFELLGLAFRQAKDVSLKEEFEALLKKEISRPGAVIPL